MGLENESWNDTEQVLKDFLFQHLGFQKVKIERAHRTGEKREDTSKKIEVKFSSYRTKEMILKNGRKLKGTGYYINEEFSKETVEIRKKIGRRLRNSEKMVNMLYYFMIKFSGEKRDLQKTLLKFVQMFQKNINFVFCFL